MTIEKVKSYGENEEHKDKPEEDYDQQAARFTRRGEGRQTKGESKEQGLFDGSC